MTSERHRFNDLGSMIDEVHALFDTWENGGTRGCIGDLTERMYRAKLAVHEWLANLVQHAQFPEHPEIVLEVRHEDSELECVIEDNSEGFDLAEQLQTRRQIADAFPERGMGLLILHACTYDLTYSRKDDGRQRLQFRVSDDYRRPIDIPF